MDILKYFADEPAALHGPSPPDGPRASGDLVPLDQLLAGPVYYRGYLAGTHLPGPEGPLRVGATALRRPQAWIDPLLALFPAHVWTGMGVAGTHASVEDPAPVLAQPRGTAVLAASPDGSLVPDLTGLDASERREALPALRTVLDQGVVVFLPEPAHDGFDWSVFSVHPLRDRFVDALTAHPAPDGRRFVVPYQKARSEHKFYFEQWQLDALPSWIVEV